MLFNYFTKLQEIIKGTYMKKRFCNPDEKSMEFQ